MNIILACFHTSVLRSALEAQGHIVHSCDLKESKSPGQHFRQNIKSLDLSSYDMMLCFPPCQYLCKAQDWMCQRDPKRAADREKAVEFAKWLFSQPVPMIAMENPVGYLSRAWQRETQIVRPWMFGDPYGKEICLWLKNLPPLISTVINPIRKSISNHTNSRMSPEQRSEIRSSWDYYPGMCTAIADQWSRPIGLSYRPVAHRFE